MVDQHWNYATTADTQIDAIAALKQGPGGDDIEALFKLLEAAPSRDSVISMLEAQPALWHAVDAQGCTLLHFGALAGDVQLVCQALAVGVQPDACCDTGQTPLMWAITKGQVRVSKVLLDASANPEHKDNSGVTPFILSVQHKQHMALLFLASRVAPNELLEVRDANGCQAVHWAAYLGSIDSLRLLSYFDADFCSLDNGGCTPLHRAIMNPQLGNKADVLKFLLENKADATVMDYKERNCIDLAQQLGQQIALQALSKLMARRSPAYASDDGFRKYKQFLKERMFTICWWCCVFLCVIQYFKEMRELSWSLTPFAAILFEVGLPLMAISFIYTSYLDPGSVLVRMKRGSGVEEIMAAFSRPDSQGDDLSFERLCLTTWALKGLRTKYCTSTGTCIEEFDHFCPWMNSPVGRGNHRLFVFHTCAQLLVLWCQFYSCFRRLSDLKANHRAANPDVGFCKCLFALASDHPLLMLVLLVETGALLVVAPLAFDQMMGIFRNLTTNEKINMKRYQHFWEMAERPSGETYWKFTNPFDKGSLWLNWLDFWWMRTRREKRPQRTSCNTTRPQWCRYVWFKLQASWTKRWNRKCSDHLP